MNIRYIVLIILSILFWRHGYAQYPTSGVKQRLGYQTTGDGLVYRGNGSPAYTPSGTNSAWAYIDTTVGTIYTYYAGSWHLVSAGGGGTFDGHVDSLVFNSSVTVVDSIGKMYYDAGNETISVGIDGGAVYQMGQELYYPLVINKSGATIHNGQPVMVDTATLVTGDHVRVIPARNGAAYPSEYVMGVATTDIPNDSTGLVTWFGYVREVKESDVAQTGVTLAAGDILYISATEAGKYTNVAPSTPYHRSTIALVARRPNANNLTLLVRPWLAPRLADLSDVNTSSVTGLSVLRYNSSAGTWDASATAGIVAADTAAMLVPYVNVADTAAMLNAYPLGSATSGQVAYWDGSRSLTGSSGLTWNESSKYLKVTNGSYYGILKGYNTGVVAITGESNGAYGWGFSNTTISNLYGNDIRFSSNIKIGSVNQAASYALHIESSNAIKIPVGTTAQRPTGASGVLRFNSDNTGLEYHNGTSWNGLQSTITNPVTGTGTAGQIAYWSGTGTQTGSNNLFWDATNARLGVGTNAPARNLQINGTGLPSLHITNAISGATSTDGVVLGIVDSNVVLNNFEPGYVNFGTRDTSRMLIFRNGNINIGSGLFTDYGYKLYVDGKLKSTNTIEATSFAANTTTPQRTIHGNVSTGLAGLILTNNTSGATSTDGTQLYTDGTNTAFGNFENGYLAFLSNATERMRITNGGLFGILKNNPSYTIDINATDAIRIPSGTTAQRPTGAAAVLRYNSDSLRIEYHTGTAWKGIAKTEELPAATTGFPRAAPIAVILSTYTVGATDTWIICDYAGTITLTLPAAAGYPGREIMVKTIRAQSVVSASSNVVPIDSNTAGTAILAATAGKWATLVSTGSQWVIMQSN